MIIYLFHHGQNEVRFVILLQNFLKDIDLILLLVGGKYYVAHRVDCSIKLVVDIIHIFIDLA